MLNLSNTQRNWVVLAIAAWIVALIGLIFIPQSRPEAAEVKIAPTNSLTTSLAGARPNSGAVVAECQSRLRLLFPMKETPTHRMMVLSDN